MICFTLQLYLQLWFFKELSKENYFDIFWASSLITSYSFITATPSYTYKISGSGTSFPYSSWVVDSSLSQIHTIHSFIPTSLTAPIFLSLNLTDGSAISQLYNFSMPCSATYHMEMKGHFLVRDWLLKFVADYICVRHNHKHIFVLQIPKLEPRSILFGRRPKFRQVE